MTPDHEEARGMEEADPEIVCGDCKESSPASDYAFVVSGKMEFRYSIGSNGELYETGYLFNQDDDGERWECPYCEHNPGEEAVNALNALWSHTNGREPASKV